MSSQSYELLNARVSRGRQILQRCVLRVSLACWRAAACMPGLVDFGAAPNRGSGKIDTHGACHAGCAGSCSTRIVTLPERS